MKKSNMILCIIFLSWIYGMLIGHILIPDRSLSEMENRSLAKFPAFTTEKLFSGKYGEDFEKYLGDQFPLRDVFIQISTGAQYMMRKRQIGDVYFTRSGRLIPQILMSDEERLQSNVRSLQWLSQLDIPMYTALIPDASCILQDMLPYGAPVIDQKSLIDKIYDAVGSDRCVDIYTALYEERDSYIYYRTDHHWTSLGAYYGYAAIMKAMDIEPVQIDNCQPVILSDSFYGTLYSKAPAFWIEADTIHAVISDMGVDVTAFDGINYEDKALYEIDNLNKKDKYTVFLGGNQPLVVISTAVQSAPRLLVLRDSYFDSLSPFLQSHFSEIHLIDTRYYQQDIQTYIEKNDIDIILAAYSVDQFLNVMNLSVVIYD